MYVSRLELTNFRNFERGTFPFDAKGAAICGANGRGKSNLLEAVFFLAVGKSGRGTLDRDVVRWGSDHYVIEAQVQREDGPLAIRVAYDHRARAKRAFLRSDALARLSQLVGTFNAVLFSPEDVDLVLREPAERRRLLDILVSQSSAPYLSDLEHYRRALSQRNRLLKEAGPALLRDPARLLPWDGQLAVHGARIVEARLGALEELRPDLGRYYADIAPTGEVLGVRYEGVVAEEGTAPGGRDQKAALEGAYASRRRDEIEAGYTLSGPHRDNVVFVLDGHAAHRFGSKGQMKSVLLAWKLAEAAFLERRTGFRPVLLMDDVFSELDRDRALSALDAMAGFGQVLLTSARDPDLSLADRGYGVIAL